MKLGRIKGERVDFLTWFKSPKMMLLSMTGIIMAMIITIEQVNVLGTEKQKTVSLIRKEKYQYNFTDGLALHSANWFYVE